MLASFSCCRKRWKNEKKSFFFFELFSSLSFGACEAPRGASSRPASSPVLGRALERARSRKRKESWYSLRKANGNVTEPERRTKTKKQKLHSADCCCCCFSRPRHRPLELLLDLLAPPALAGPLQRLQRRVESKGRAKRRRRAERRSCFFSFFLASSSSSPAADAPEQQQLLFFCLFCPLFFFPIAPPTPPPGSRGQPGEREHDPGDPGPEDGAGG